jgi:predicted ABC-type ATPase
MTAPKPTLIIIAGPNGAGKSTFTRATQEALQVPIIDPDLEARKLRPDNPEAAAIDGGRQAIKRARAYLGNNESFAVETTLSGNTYLRMMAEAKQKGWQVNLLYVGVDNVQTSIERVAQRVAAGGHNVPEADIRRRYARSLANLPVALQQADSTSIFDNSTREGYRKVLTIENGRVTEQASELPEWLKASLPQEVIEPNQSKSTQ